MNQMSSVIPGNSQLSQGCVSQFGKSFSQAGTLQCVKGVEHQEEEMRGDEGREDYQTGSRK